MKRIAILIASIVLFFTGHNACAGQPDPYIMENLRVFASELRCKYVAYIEISKEQNSESPLSMHLETVAPYRGYDVGYTFQPGPRPNLLEGGSDSYPISPILDELDYFMGISFEYHSAVIFPHCIAFFKEDDKHILKYAIARDNRWIFDNTLYRYGLWEIERWAMVEVTGPIDIFGGPWTEETAEEK